MAYTEEQITGTIIIILVVFVDILYMKMILIWRDVMLKQNDRWFTKINKLCIYPISSNPLENPD